MLRDAFTALPEVQDWGYWDNVDRDENVTVEEWEVRREVWRRAIPPGTSPAERGLTWNLVGSRGHMIFPSRLPPEKLAEYVPTPMERARVEARKRVRAEAGKGRYRIPGDRWGRSDPEAMSADVERFTAEIAPSLPPLDVADILAVSPNVKKGGRPG